jgi:hypothetical protein
MHCYLLNHARQLGAALDATKGRALPDTASDQLEWTSRDLLASTSHTDDDRRAPTLMARLESSALQWPNHAASIIEQSIGQVLLDVLDGRKFEAPTTIPWS